VGRKVAENAMMGHLQLMQALLAVTHLVQGHKLAIYEGHMVLGGRLGHKDGLAVQRPV
jgi:hypothetical protein